MSHCRSEKKAGVSTVNLVLQNLHLQVRPIEFELLPKANAWAYKITIYDVLYVALAEQLGYPLIIMEGQVY